MILQDTIDLLTKYSDRSDVVIFYCEEVFQYIDLEDASFETDNGTSLLKDVVGADFTGYNAEELEVEDNIFEFIKDYKKSLNSVDCLHQYPKKLLLFMSGETLLTSAEALQEICSLEYNADYGDKLSLWSLTKIRCL